MQTIILNDIRAFADAIKKCFLQLKSHHSAVIARQNKAELQAWSNQLHDAHVSLRQSFMRLPSELSMDDPDVVEIVKAMTSIAKMANECREASALA